MRARVEEGQMKTPWHSRPIPVEPDPRWPGRSLNKRYLGIGVECPGRGAELVVGPTGLVVHCPDCQRDMRYKLEELKNG